MKSLVRSHRRLFFALLLCCIGVLAFGLNRLNWRVVAAPPDSQADQTSPDGIWQSVGERQGKGLQRPARTYRLNKDSLENLLNRAPLEGALPLNQSPVIFTLPLPDGSFSRFRIEESPVFDQALAARFPEIKSYRGQGVDNTLATVRFDLSPLGFHALVMKPEEAIEITPATQTDLTLYQSNVTQVGDFTCEAIKWQDPARDNLDRTAAILTANGALRRNYRIAIATTGEYFQLYGGDNTNVLASINAWLNAVNAIYEKELAVHLNLVNNTTILYSNGATDPFTNGTPNTMLNQVRPILRDQVGAANYDLGHVLGTNSGGVAYLGVICNDNDNAGDGLGPLKGGGASGMSGTAGTGGSVGLLAHEIGHQFGSDHTFNGTTGSCAGTNRAPTIAYEVGSGSTIMAYGGICGSDNITNSRDLRFHAGSTIKILAHLNGAGGACAATVATGNTPPTVTSGGNFTIPKQTPFNLTATGNDADPADVPNLTFAWEQLDAGGVNFANPPYGDQVGDPANTTRPLFRAYSPTTSPVRTFPSLTYILNNANVPPLDLNGLKTGEALPSIGRTLNFRVTVRDNRADNGGINDADMVLTVNGATGPFDIIGPNGGENIVGGAATNVTWNVAGTSGAPINTANVKISLSLDGGLTFPTVLAASTPNDGAEILALPNGLLSTAARLKIEAIGNIFFDISNANFSLTPGDGCPAVSNINPLVTNTGGQVVLTGVNFTGVTAVNYTNANVTCPSANCTVNSSTQITLTTPAGAVSGPLTLVRAGCANLITALLTVCPNPPATLQYDDGNPASASGLGTAGFFVLRATPGAYPATLSHVALQFDEFQMIPTGTAITIVTAANAGGSTNINGLNFQTTNATVGTLGQFVNYPVAPLTINAGDFVVGFSIANIGFPGLRDTAATANRSYTSSNGSSFTANTNGDFFIRAVVFTGDCSGPPLCPIVNNLNPANGTVGSLVVITGANFTGVTSVKFNNDVNAVFTVDSATQISATVPTGAMNGPIKISKPNCTDVNTAPLHG